MRHILCIICGADEYDPCHSSLKRYTGRVPIYRDEIPRYLLKANIEERDPEGSAQQTPEGKITNYKILLTRFTLP